MKLRLRVMAAILGIAAIACGCSTAGRAPAGQHQLRFKLDQADWSLPLDSYLPDIREAGYAANIEFANCMRSKHVSVPVFNYADQLPPTRNKILRKLFTTSLASRYGYKPGPVRIPTRPPVKYRGAQEADAVACTEWSQRKIRTNYAAQDFVQVLALRAGKVAIDSAAVIKSAKRWRGCMSGLHLPDLPVSPSSMPTPSQMRRFGSGERPGRAEVREAMLDAKCRTSSQFDRVYYRSEVADQLQQIAHHAAQVQKAARTCHTSMMAIKAIIANWRALHPS